MTTETAGRATELARSQDDVITRGRARECGLTASAVAHRVTHAGWSIPARGGLTVPPIRDPVRTAARAAVTAAGPGAVLSHRSAAVPHEFPNVPRARDRTLVARTLPSAVRRGQPGGLHLHRPRISTRIPNLNLGGWWLGCG